MLFVSSAHTDCIVTEDTEVAELFRRQVDRFYGFAICLSAGLTCTLLLMLVFFNPFKFGITFFLGNLMALGSIPYRPTAAGDDDATALYLAMYSASLNLKALVLTVLQISWIQRHKNRMMYQIWRQFMVLLPHLLRNVTLSNGK